ncbi:DUF397 domain-containing protein [Streptomyces sp. NPDC050617]|uniref:DUF397 domain-containing protein n=1 Tax=Streptomyces sp. NPDC050617 TaxID=3154628 RepID=UPI003433CBA8
MTTESPRWSKSTYSQSNGGECVEWAPTVVRAHGTVPIRDSKDPGGPTLTFPKGAWTQFVAEVKGGGFTTA